MKYIVLIPDGSADEPRPELNGKTPLEAAATPNFDRLAGGGRIGLVRTIPEGFPAGSDVANLSVMGYDPGRYYSGRAPLEAASLGIELRENDVAFRCNLVFVKDGVMRDFAAGHISSSEAAPLIEFIGEKLGGDDVRFYPGLSYRHIMVSSGRALKAECTPPHDIIGKEIEDYLPRGEDSDWLRGLMNESRALLEDHPVNRERAQNGKAPANMIWLWGQGKAPLLPTLRDRFGLSGSVISAVDLIKGLGKYAGLEAVEVPGATGYIDTDYEAKGRCALKELETKDFVYVHVEAPDEASHMGDTALKVEAIERFDAGVAGTLLDGLQGKDSYRILLLPDHATPLSLKTHSRAAVPFLIYDSSKPEDNRQAFDERTAAESNFLYERGWELMEHFLKG